MRTIAHFLSCKINTAISISLFKIFKLCYKLTNKIVSKVCIYSDKVCHLKKQKTKKKWFEILKFEIYLQFDRRQNPNSAVNESLEELNIYIYESMTPE